MSGNLHAALLIAAMSLVTMLLRFLPFIIFSGRHEVPKVILYLGDVLPSAVLGMLVIYCLKDVSFAAAPYGLPELMASAVTAILQGWKHNTILSIAGGTAFYMVLLAVL